VIVLVRLLEPRLVHMGMRVLLAVVLVLVLDVLVVVAGMSVGVRLVAVTVLMAVRLIVLMLHRASSVEVGSSTLRRPSAAAAGGR
jgi:hypothetical protein